LCLPNITSSVIISITTPSSSQKSELELRKKKPSSFMSREEDQREGLQERAMKLFAERLCRQQLKFKCGPLNHSIGTIWSHPSLTEPGTLEPSSSSQSPLEFSSMPPPLPG
ncbi:mCG1042652, isoform CRA_a, partial [Mus musculus]